MEEISSLSAEVRTLRDAVDELREILTYAVINGRMALSLPSAAPDSQVMESVDDHDHDAKGTIKRQAKLF